MKTKVKIAVLCHIFYEDTYESVCQELQPILVFDTIFLFNLCSDTPDKENISAALRKNFPSCFIINTSNKGKDIGGKLALLQLFLELKLTSDYLLFLHDKKSLQALKSTTWKKDLLKIISHDKVHQVIDMFDTSERCGIVATKEYVITEGADEKGFTGINKDILARLRLEYRVNPPSFTFVAGTIFWARANPVKEFFTLHNPLEIRKQLEDGNVLDNFSGTITHSWERMLSWIITSNDFLIKGV